MKEKLRSKLKCSSYFEDVSESDKVDIVATKGLTKYCVLNDLQYFNIFENLYVDLMHDIFEGVIPSFLENFFEYCASKKIISKTLMIQMVRDFNYRSKDRKNLPSTLKFNKKNFNQNATQTHCLMLNLPFIFFEYREKLQLVWPVMESLLSCLQIICSDEIRESHIVRLELHSEQPLNDMKNIFGIVLKPKHHFFTHYATVIRKQGPLVGMWMMRYERKHRFFTDTAKRTQNFVNITKTLVESHRLYMASCLFTIPEIQSSNIRRKIPYNIKQTMKDHFGFIAETAHVVNLFTYNAYRYAVGLMIIENHLVYAIEAITVLDKNHFLICKPFDVLKFNTACYSIQVNRRKNRKPLCLRFYWT